MASKHTTGDRHPLPRTLSHALNDAVADQRIRLAEGSLSTALAGGRNPFIALLEKTAGVGAAAASGHVHAAEGAMKQAAAAFMDAAEDIGIRLLDLTTERNRLAAACAELRAAHDVLELKLLELEDRAARDLATARAQWATERIVLEAQLIDAQRLASASDNPMVQRASAYITRLPTELGACVTAIQTCAEQLEAIDATYLQKFAELEGVIIPCQSPDGEIHDEVRTLADEIDALRAEASPYCALPYAIVPEDRDRLIELRDRYDRVVRQYIELVSFLGTLRTESEETDKAQRAHAAAFRSIAERIDRALAFLPECFPKGTDIFAIAGSTKEQVVALRDRARLGRERCAAALRTIQLTIQRLEGTYASKQASLEQSKASIERLCDSVSIQWYDQLPEDAQTVIRAAVLAMSDEKGTWPFATAADILSHAGLWDRSTERRDALAALLRPAFFAPAGGPSMMRLLRLTEVAMFWARRWRSNDPGLAARMERARKARAAAVEAANATKTERRQKRALQRSESAISAERRSHEAAAQAELQRIELEDPVRIKGAMDTAEQQIFRIIAALVPTLPNGAGLDRCVRIAAVTAALDVLPLRPTREHAIANAIYRVVYAANPPLLHLGRDAVGTRTMLTPIGQRVFANIESISLAQLLAIEAADLLPLRQHREHMRRTIDAITAKVQALRAKHAR